MGEQSVKIRAIHDHVLVTDMDFGDKVTSSGIILQSDDGKAHGVHPRWGKVYAVGPEQTDVKIGQWVLVEHGRWTRGHKLENTEVRRIEFDAILVVSDDPPNQDDIMYGQYI